MPKSPAALYGKRDRPHQPERHGRSTPPSFPLRKVTVSLIAVLLLVTLLFVAI